MEHINIVILFIVHFPANAGVNDKNLGDVTIDEVTSIYGADAFRANINAWPPIVGECMSIRVNGVGASDIRGKCDKEKKLARDAKQFTVGQLRNAKKIELRNMRRVAKVMQSEIVK